MKCKKNRRGSYIASNTVTKSWILSYVIIVSIPVIIASFLMVHSLQYMKEENKKICQEELKTLGSILDAHFQEMERIASELSMDPQLNSLASVSDFTSKEHYLCFEFQKLLRTYRLCNSNISHLGVMLLDHDSILTGTNHTSLTYAGSKILGTELIDLLKDRTFQRDFYYLPESETFAYIRSVPFSSKVPSRNYLFVTLEPSIWKNITENQKDYTFIVTLGEEKLQSTAPSEMQKSDCLILSSDSLIDSTFYTFIVRSTEASRHIHLIQFIMIFSSGTAILVSIFLVFYFTRKNYRPLSRLMGKVTPGFSLGNNNEYHVLENYIEEIQKESSTLKQELSKSLAMTEDLYLVKLLRSSYSKEDFFRIEELALWRYPEEQEDLTLALLVFSIDSLSYEDISKEPDENLALTHFIINNILGDLIDSDLRWKSVYLDEHFVVIIHGYLSALNQTCSLITAQMPPLLNIFHTRIQIGISVGCRPLDQIYRIYREALKALEYCHLYNASHTYYEEKLAVESSISGNIRSVISIQHRFQNIILAQDYSLAVQQLPQLFSCCFQENQTISVLRLNMYSLVSLYRSCLLELAERADYVQAFYQKHLCGNAGLYPSCQDLPRQRAIRDPEILRKRCGRHGRIPERLHLYPYLQKA